MPRLTGELKRLARRIAKSYGHELGAWEEYGFDWEGEFYAECGCGAMVGLQLNEDDARTPYLCINGEIVERCKNATDTG